jgi:hypothetical protein
MKRQTGKTTNKQTNTDQYLEGSGLNVMRSSGFTTQFLKMHCSIQNVVVTRGGGAFAALSAKACKMT